MILTYIWFCSLAVVLELFMYWDWDYGIYRGLLMLALGLISLVPTVFSQKPPNLPISILYRQLSWLFFAFLLGNFLFCSFKNYQNASKAGDLSFDQGQNSYRAWLMLKKGHNPYGKDAILDSVEFHNLLSQIKNKKECLQHLNLNQIESSFDAYWKSVSPELLRKLRIDMKLEASCAEFNPISESLGFKYGPALIGFYGLFIDFFGPAGIFITHIFFFIFFLAIVFLSFRKNFFFSPTAVIAFSILLFVPDAFRTNGFVNSASDSIPTLLACSSFLLLSQKQSPLLSAFLLALSLSSKTFPGLLYLPVIAYLNRKSFIFCMLLTLIFHLQFMLWDISGFFNDLIFFNLTRTTDSTAFLHFLSPALQKTTAFFSTLCIFLVIVYYWKKSYPVWNSWRILIISHVLTLFSAKTFHNNYLSWIQVLLALWTLYLLRSNSSFRDNIL